MKEGLGRPWASCSGSSRGQPWAMWMLTVRMLASPRVIAAGPSPLWASTSLTPGVRPPQPPQGPPGGGWLVAVGPAVLVAQLEGADDFFLQRLGIQPLNVLRR